MTTFIVVLSCVIVVLPATKTGLELCEALFSAFETPYRTYTEEGKKLVLAANNAFKKRSSALHAHFRSVVNKNETRRRNSRRDDQTQTKYNKTREQYQKRSTEKNIQPGFNYEKSLRRYKVQNGVPTRKLKPILHTRKTPRIQQTVAIEKNILNSYAKNQVMVTEHAVGATKNGYLQKRFNIVTSAPSNGDDAEQRIKSSNQRTINYIKTNRHKNSNRRATKSFPRANNNQNTNTSFEKNISNTAEAEMSLPNRDLKKNNLHKMVDSSSIGDEEILKLRLLDHLFHYNVSYQRYPENNSALDEDIENDDEIVLKSHLYKAVNV